MVIVGIAALIGIFLLLQACFQSWRLALIAFLALPVVVGGLVPWLLLEGDDWRMPGTILGWPVLLFGMGVVLRCVRDFYAMGKGTLAPWDPLEIL
jgi:multidrug efflux pump subunit AcrB